MKEELLEQGDECPNCHCGTIEETDEEFVCQGECGEIWAKERVSVCMDCGASTEVSE